MPQAFTELKKMCEAAGCEASTPDIRTEMCLAYGTYYEIVLASLYGDSEIQAREKVKNLEKTFKSIETTTKEWGHVGPYIHETLQSECARLILRKD